MPGHKLRKKTSKTVKTSKTSKAARTPRATKRPKKTRTLKAAKSRKVSKARVARKPVKQPPPHKDETAVRLGPHHLDRHPIPAGLRVHPAPMMPMIAVKHSGMTARHH